MLVMSSQDRLAAEQGHAPAQNNLGLLHYEGRGVERSLEEVRRRTKVIGRFPGESSCLTMAWAVMDLVIAGGKGLGLSLAERHAIAATIADRAAPRTDQQVA